MNPASLSQPEGIAGDIFTVHAVPVPPDNYAYLVAKNGLAAVVDPGAADPVRCELARRNLRLTAIVNTHGHPDHTRGNAGLKAEFGCPVWAPADPRIPAVDHRLAGGDVWSWQGLAFDVLATPGHTTACVSLHEPAQGWLFCGDVLFLGGCGRVMECPPEVLHQSLTRLAALPGHTRVYCGHEFTEANLRFALSLLPHDPALLDALAQASALRARGESTVPGTIGQERLANPYLRAAEPAWQQAVGLPGASAVEVFAEIRRRKNEWRG